LVGCVSGDDELTKENGSIAILGKDQKFTMLEGDALQTYLDRLEVKNAADNDDEEEEKEEGDAMET
jgi:20S proteasome subunit alpha 6